MMLFKLEKWTIPLMVKTQIQGIFKEHIYRRQYGFA